MHAKALYTFSGILSGNLFEGTMNKAGNRRNLLVDPKPVVVKKLLSFAPAIASLKVAAETCKLFNSQKLLLQSTMHDFCNPSIPLI